MGFTGQAAARPAAERGRCADARGRRCGPAGGPGRFHLSEPDGAREVGRGARRRLAVGGSGRRRGGHRAPLSNHLSPFVPCAIM
jgi:hypothetical protein